MTSLKGNPPLSAILIETFPKKKCHVYVNNLITAANFMNLMRSFSTTTAGVLDCGASMYKKRCIAASLGQSRFQFCLYSSIWSTLPSCVTLRLFLRFYFYSKKTKSKPIQTSGITNFLFTAIKLFYCCFIKHCCLVYKPFFYSRDVVTF